MKKRIGKLLGALKVSSRGLPRPHEGWAGGLWGALKVSFRGLVAVGLVACGAPSKLAFSKMHAKGSLCS